MSAVEVRIVDDQEQDVAVGEVGDVIVRGPDVMLGYCISRKLRLTLCGAVGCTPANLVCETMTATSQLSTLKHPHLGIQRRGCKPVGVHAAARQRLRGESNDVGHARGEAQHARATAGQ